MDRDRVISSICKRKAAILAALHRRYEARELPDRLWDQMPAVGREFGSPDFERLMEEDFGNGARVVGHSLCGWQED